MKQLPVDSNKICIYPADFVTAAARVDGVKHVANKKHLQNHVQINFTWGDVHMYIAKIEIQMYTTKNNLLDTTLL